ncbi:MAG: pyruvate, phosphate dikinase [Bacteroidales bacterium]|nr:pyruvate, phosphate dikinase [Bacteroidales bacterium]
MEENNKTDSELNRLLLENRERMKELAALNQTTSILKENKPIDETLQQISYILPRAWQYPEFTCARIRYNTKVYTSPDFQESEWYQVQPFETIDGKKGVIEIYYTKDYPEEYEGPFLKEERELLNNIVSLITGYLDRLKAKEVFFKNKMDQEEAETEAKTPLTKEIRATSRQLLQMFLNKNNADRDIYHDLMPYKVKEILLIANLYDAYIIEKEGRFSEYVLGEYYQLSLTSMPRITGVTTLEEAIEQLKTKHFDLIIIMVGVDKKTPVTYSKKLKKEFNYIPIYILLNNNNDIELYKRCASRSIDKVFVWNGDSRMFFAMIKLLEDQVNTENDTEVGLVRVILLVEDSPKYYSRYLPMLYSIVLEQTKRIIEDVTTDELYKVLKLRARPKILHAQNYEEAVDVFNKYKDFMLCLITDMKFEKGGIEEENAGEDLIKFIRNSVKELPIILQSSEGESHQKAYQYKASFIDKNSSTLAEDFKSFITHYLGFGNFIYRNKEGITIAEAKSLKEFENLLKVIPDESLIYHARQNHFSLWLMARGEIQVAKIINPAKVSDFSTPDSLRLYLINIIEKFRNEQNKGKVIPYEEMAMLDASNIVSLATGALGGKGRGLAFINSLIQNFDFAKMLPNINICTPKTSVIGTDEFEYFMERNQLKELAYLPETNYEDLKAAFVQATLTETTIKRLKALIKLINKPLAVRSSGLFEDSLMQPFAGIFDTYLLPNNHPNSKVRLEQLMSAVKLVYASVFSATARGYIEAVNYKLEEERMAVIIQEVVGNGYEDSFYPHFSGVAQSYNYYPYSHMKPEEGFAVLALGLGKYVVEGEKAFRFSPAYPTLEINSAKDQYKNSQLHFYAVNMGNKELNLLQGEDAGLIKLDIEEAEKHGTIKHCVSVFDIENERIVAGLGTPGPRIINFADILKYNYIPLAKTLSVVLDIVKEAMGTPVEIEFAVDLNKDANNNASFFLLQIKPLIGNAQDHNININEIDKDKIILFTEKAMGNGIIDNISDLIYFRRDKFDKTKTEEMVAEISLLNKEMINKGRKYILIGPGRWGTRDRYIGIPVTWPQISNAKIIVETSFDDFPLEASSGSHFFHNVTSMDVGYFTVQQELPNNYIKWDLLDAMPIITETKYFRHISFERNLIVRMDGKKRISVINCQ